MTAENALNAEPASFENSVLHHRLNHILTARRGVAARRRRERRYAGAVEIDREKEYVTEDTTHCIGSTIHGRCSGLGYFGDEFDHGALDLGEVGELLIHIVDGDMEGATLGFELL